MNKKQWNALAILFLTICPIWFLIFHIPLIKELPYETFGVAAWIVMHVSNMLLFILFIVSIVCFLCGWLEKEEAK